MPRVIDSGVGPLMLEYIDMLTMQAATQAADLDLGIPAEVREQALAYLVVALESGHADRLDDDVQRSAELLDTLGAIDVYVLPPQAAEQLISARERAFFVAKALGADDIIDVVVPRAVIPEYLAAVGELAQRRHALVAGCGHAGDGNVHLSVFQRDPAERHAVLHGIFALGMELGGAISGEHGLGLAKQEHFLVLEDPVKIALLRRLKAAFDPNGILNPATSLGPDPSAGRPRPPPTRRWRNVAGATAPPAPPHQHRPPTHPFEETDERRPGPHEHVARLRRGRRLHEPGHVGDAIRGRSRRRARHARRAVPVRGRRHRRRRGYARVAGKPAATLLHLGPGLANGLANLHNARRAHTPVVNIVGDHATYHKQYDAPSSPTSTASPGRCRAGCGRRRSSRSSAPTWPTAWPPRSGLPARWRR